MRIILLSDTHMRHTELALPRADLLLHAGDFTRRGSRGETVAFLDWLACLQVPAVLTPGNHDVFAEQNPAEMASLCAARGIKYLVDAATTIAGVRIYASPWTPRFRNMAFNADRGIEIRGHWSKIPTGLDILMTHGPPAGAGDRTFSGYRAGCHDLLDAIRSRPPRMHVFGHIHEAAGEHQIPGCPARIINVATSRLVWGTREPRVVDW